MVITGWRGGEVEGGSDGSYELPAMASERIGEGDRTKGEKASRMERREASAVVDMQESEDATRCCVPMAGRP